MPHAELPIEVRVTGLWRVQLVRPIVAFLVLMGYQLAALDLANWALSQLRSYSRVAGQSEWTQIDLDPPTLEYEDVFHA